VTAGRFRPLGQAPSATPPAPTAPGPSAGSLALGAVIVLGVGSMLVASAAAHDKQWRAERGLSRDY
jgi:hypothetical protein